MALNDLYNVIKADRYTADGCEKLNEALAKETEDRVYQNGEISQKTGLMKTPKGWVEPKKGAKRINALEGGKKGMVAGEPRNALQPKPKLTEQNYNEQKEVLKKFENVPEEKKNNNPYYVHAVDVVKQWEEQKDTENKPAAENKPAESKSAAPQKKSQSAKSVKEYLENNFWSQPEDFKNEMNDAGWDVDEMTSEYAVISNESGSQYEVRFNSHGDGRDLTVKTFKALQVDEDDDDNLEDAAPKIRQLTGDCKIRIRKA